MRTLSDNSIITNNQTNFNIEEVKGSYTPNTYAEHIIKIIEMVSPALGVDLKGTSNSNDTKESSTSTGTTPVVENSNSSITNIQELFNST